MASSYFIGDIAESISDTFDKDKFEDVVLINTSDVLNGDVLNHISTPNNNLKGQFKKTFKKGDILYSEIRPGNCHYAYVDFNAEGYVASTKLMVIRGNNECNPKYLYYYLTSQNIINYLQMQAESRSGTFPQITFDEIAALSIPKLEINKQNKIVNIIESFDKKIELNTHINMYLDNLIDCVFKCFVDNEKIIGYEKIGDLTQCLLGGTPSRKKSEYWNGNIPWINSGEVNNFRIIKPSENISKDGLDCSSTKLLPKKTIVLAITGATLGQFSLLEIDCCANQSVVGILDNDKLHYQFLYPYIKSHINDLISGQTGGAQQHINNNDIKNFEVPLFDDAAMSNYLKTITPMFDLISNNCFENNRLEKLRNALLPKLMSGEIEV